MKDTLTYKEMEGLIKANLYIFDSEEGNARPNLDYCRKDAPAYKWDTTRDPFVFVKI